MTERKSLFNSEVETGLPIGNYSSQFFANLYLDQLDQHVKRELKCNHYFRYVDDFILLSEDKEELKKWRKEIEDFLRDYLMLEINHKKTKLQPIERGIDFLGYLIKPDVVLVRQRVVRAIKGKLSGISEIAVFKSSQDRLRVVAMINSYLGHFRHADSKRLREKVCLFVYWKFSFSFSNDGKKVLEKKDEKKEGTKEKKLFFRRKKVKKRKKNKRQKSIRTINAMLSSLSSLN